MMSPIFDSLLFGEIRLRLNKISNRDFTLIKPTEDIPSCDLLQKMLEEALHDFPSIVQHLQAQPLTGNDRPVHSWFYFNLPAFIDISFGPLKNVFDSERIRILNRLVYHTRSLIIPLPAEVIRVVKNSLKVIEIYLRNCNEQLSSIEEDDNITDSDKRLKSALWLMEFTLITLCLDIHTWYQDYLLDTYSVNDLYEKILGKPAPNGFELMEASFFDRIDIDCRVITPVSERKIVDEKPGRALSRKQIRFNGALVKKFRVIGVIPTPDNLVASFEYTGDEEYLYALILDLCGKFNLLNLEKTSPAQLVAVLTAKRLDESNQFPIHVACQTKQFQYIVKKLSPLFENLTFASVAKSHLFFSMQGKEFTYSNLKASRHQGPRNAKQKKEIDKIFQQRK